MNNHAEDGFRLVGLNKTGVPLALEGTAVHCNACGQARQKRLLTHQDARFVYVDENGRRWKGNKCPDCSKRIRKPR